MIKRGVWVCNFSRGAHWKRREKSGAVVLVMWTFQDVLIFLQIGRLTLYFAACAQVFTIFFFPVKLDVTVCGWWLARLNLCSTERIFGGVDLFSGLLLPRRMHRRSRDGSKCTATCSDPPGRACCCQCSWDRARRSSSWHSSHSVSTFSHSMVFSRYCPQ